MTLEIAPGADVVKRSKECSIFRPQDLLDLLPGPDVELALLAFGIGVERGAKAAFLGGHFALQPAHRLAARARGIPGYRCAERPAPAAPEAGRCRRASSRNAAPASGRRPNSAKSRRRGGRRCRRLDIRSSECSTVSKNRASPVRIPARHSISSIAGCGNLGAPRRPPLTGSNMLPIWPRRGVELGRADGDLAGRPRLLRQPRQQRRAVLLDLFRLLAEQPRHLVQNVGEGRPAITRRRWGNKCRPTPARPPASETSSAASRPARPIDAARSCRSGRCPAVPRGRP